jgi:hypothetical protein
MDESTRIIIAYAELVLGFPLLVAKIIWFVPSVISAKALGMIAGRMDQILDAAVEGFISILSACLVFDHFQLQTVWAVPVTLIIINCLWGWFKEEDFRSWSAALGIISGFWLYPDFLTHIVEKYGFARLLFG